MDNIERAIIQSGKEGIVNELEAAGHSQAHNRTTCPWPGCVDKKRDQAHRNAAIYVSGKGHYRIHCHACGETGDILDLLQQTRGLSKAEAIDLIGGSRDWSSVPIPKLVETPKNQHGALDVDKLGKTSPSAWLRLWQSLSSSHDESERYMLSRGISPARVSSVCRFLHSKVDNPAIAKQFAAGWTIALAVKDVLGQMRGIQIRVAGQPKSESQSKMVSVSGSESGSGFFGEPERIEICGVVVVAEGMFDTLACRQWAPASVAVVGAAGKGNLKKLSAQLREAGIPVDGKTFLLMAQNDPPGPSSSRTAFQRLASQLADDGARVAFVSTPKEHKDVADWLKAEPLTEWPPKELATIGHAETAKATRSDCHEESVAVLAAAPTARHDGRFRRDMTTLVALLDDPQFAEQVRDGLEFWHNAMTGVDMLGERALTDADSTIIKYRLEGFESSADGKPLRFTRSDIDETITMLCSRNPKHPVREYLRSLPAAPEGDMFTAMADAAATPSPLAPVYWMRWCVSAVARAMTPGCKVDSVLVLSGKQGARKSTIFHELMKDPKWFSDSMPALGSADSMRILGMKWVIEWAELEATKRRDAETVKAFLTGREDTYRMPYARRFTTAPRSSVIVATTNEQTFLDDWSGSRRFWPLAVDGKIDSQWFRDHRDQIWASAMSKWKLGEQSYLTEEEDDARAHESMEFSYVDPWIGQLEAWSKSEPRDEAQTWEILSSALGLDPSRQDRPATIRLARAMARVGGWQRCQLGPNRLAGYKRTHVEDE